MRNKLFYLFLIFSFFTTSLFADSLLTQYRKYGINNLQKEMDFQLTTQKYWKNYLQNIDTTFGYMESYINILTCDKSLSSLSLYALDNSLKYKFIKKYSAYTGKIKGDKLKEGDLKTPVGIYNIVKKIAKVDSFYGPMAFVTSYPNTYDIYRGKTGQGIWIHGLPTKQSRDEFTKGCIAINNQNIECLNRNIDINKTLLIIDENVVKKDISKDDLSNVLAELYQWRYSWLYNDTNAYLNFYTKEFVRADGMKLEKFKKYKTRIFAKNEKKTILFTHLNVLPYPDSPDMYQINFFEKYDSSTFSFQGDKVLIVKLQNKHLKIITEK